MCRDYLWKTLSKSVKLFKISPKPSVYVGLSRLSIYWVCLLLLTHHSDPGDWDARHLKARMNGTSRLYVVFRNIHFTTSFLEQQSFLEPRNCPKGARFAIVRSKQISSRETGNISISVLRLPGLTDASGVCTRAEWQ